MKDYNDYGFIKSVSMTPDDIAKITKRLGEEITNDYKGKNPMFIGLLKGCLPFLSDLVRNVGTHCTLDYIKVSSYRGTESSGCVTIKTDVPDVKGRHVIVVDDILETGRTLDALKNLFLQSGAASINFCVLLDKPNARIVPIDVKYIGGEIPNDFVVGYGLDFNENYRNLPFIGVLKEEEYKK